MAAFWEGAVRSEDNVIYLYLTVCVFGLFFVLGLRAELGM